MDTKCFLALSMLPLVLSGEALSLDLGTGDLPGPAQILTVNQSSKLTVPAGESGILGGTIRIEGEDVLLTLLLEGELMAGASARIECGTGAGVRIQQTGLIQGNLLGIESERGEVRWEQAGSVRLTYLSIQNSGVFELTASGPFHAGGFRLVNGAQASALIQFDHEAFSDSWDLQNSGALSIHNSEGRVSISNLSLAQGSAAAHTDLLNEGAFYAANLAMNASGAGELHFENSGTVRIRNLNQTTLGAKTLISNSGAFTVGNWYAKDQFDESTIITIGPLYVKNLTGAANGAMGSLVWRNSGDLKVDNISLHANYGGTVLFDSTLGGLRVKTLSVAAMGYSHGKASDARVRVGRDFSLKGTAKIGDVDWDGQPLAAGESIQSGSGFARLEALYDVNPAIGPLLIFPQLALGGGYEAILILSNKTNAVWRGVVSIQEGNSLPWPGSWSLDGEPIDGTAFNVELPGYGSRRLVLRGDHELRAGFLSLSGATGCHTGDLATSFFYHFRAGSALVDSTGITGSFGARTWVVPVEKAAGVNTGIALAPSGTDTVSSVLLTLHAGDGAVAAEAAVPFTGHVAKFFAGPDGWFPSIPDGFTGKLRIAADGPVAVTALRLELTPVGFQLTSVPADDFTQ